MLRALCSVVLHIYSSVEEFWEETAELWEQGTKLSSKIWGLLILFCVSGLLHLKPGRNLAGDRRYFGVEVFGALLSPLWDSATHPQAAWDVGC